MEQYIDKSAVVAEIRKIYNEDYKFLPSDIVESVQDFKDDLLRALDTLEVEEPTASDRGIAEEIIINLKRVEQDYHIDLTREMEWLRNKTQKGE